MARVFSIGVFFNRVLIDEQDWDGGVWARVANLLGGMGNGLFADWAIGLKEAGAEGNVMNVWWSGGR